ncbi:MAG: hypothetical protein QF632_01780 [Candidatus Woesearchaeota archaeon]|jgi:hypothetical protein|nr:hypothetical protein [Candidatus Woesearchaeota archaeon]MDP7323471.1 hypothetical protein [Candidatus Woesearchaeota archaeon]|tara:strand:+ start:87 stop:269 length:183 start_codon:yes stop_codon:yes gene_type:complete
MAKNDPPASHKLNDEHCCKHCIKFDEFKDKCNVYWDNKKFCTMKVHSTQEWNEEKLMLGK